MRSCEVDDEFIGGKVWSGMQRKSDVACLKFSEAKKMGNCFQFAYVAVIVTRQKWLVGFERIRRKDIFGKNIYIC